MPDSYDFLESIPVDGKKDALIDQLQNELAQIRKERREERFCWGLTVIILLNVFFFANINSWGAAVSILFLELVLFIILAVEVKT